MGVKNGLLQMKCKQNGQFRDSYCICKRHKLQVWDLTQTVGLENLVQNLIIWGQESQVRSIFKDPDVLNFHDGYRIWIWIERYISDLGWAVPSYRNTLPRFYKMLSSFLVCLRIFLKGSQERSSVFQNVELL